MLACKPQCMLCKLDAQAMQQDQAHHTSCFTDNINSFSLVTMLRLFCHQYHVVSELVSTVMQSTTSQAIMCHDCNRPNQKSAGHPTAVHNFVLQVSCCLHKRTGCPYQFTTCENQNPNPNTRPHSEKVAYECLKLAAWGVDAGIDHFYTSGQQCASSTNVDPRAIDALYQSYKGG